MRRILDSHGDRGAALWATEVGWSDRGPDGRFSLGRQGQGRAIASVFPLLWRARRALRLHGLVYFNWRDAPPYPGGKDFWGLHTGLLTQGGAPKPALAAARRGLAQLR